MLSVLLIENPEFDLIQIREIERNCKCAISSCSTVSNELSLWMLWLNDMQSAQVIKFIHFNLIIILVYSEKIM